MPRAAFLVGFEAREGWSLLGQWPDDEDLRGVESTVLPSGSHLTDEDVIFFTCEGQRGRQEGVAASLNTADELEERGARLRSLGILLKEGQDDGKWWEWVDVLRQAVQTCSTLGKAELQKQLQDLVETKRPRRTHLETSSDLENRFHPLHSLYKVPLLLRANLWLVWRAVLLQQRILIVTQAPIMDACIDTWNMASLVRASQDWPTSPCLGAIGLHDLQRLKDKGGGWIACTTDRILLESRDLFDVVWDVSNASKGSTGSLSVNASAHECLRSGNRAVDKHLERCARPSGRDKTYSAYLSQFCRLIDRASQHPNNLTSTWSERMSNFITTTVNFLFGGWFGWWLWQKPPSGSPQPTAIRIENHDPAWTSLAEDADALDREQDEPLLQSDAGSDLVDLAGSRPWDAELSLAELVDERTRVLVQGLCAWTESDEPVLVITSRLLEELGLSANHRDARFVRQLLLTSLGQDASKVSIELDYVDVLLDWLSRHLAR